MSKITELKYKSQKNAGKVILEEAIKRLQSAIELKDQGKEAEGDKAVNEVWLDEEIKQIFLRALKVAIVEKEELIANINIMMEVVCEVSEYKEEEKY